jgi:proteic killer suppression protein
MAIRSFKDKGLRRLFEKGEARGVSAEWADKLRLMLTVIDGARTVEQIGLYPGWRLHPMTGDLKGFWSLTVSANWRLLFRFEDGDAFDLFLYDPH